MKKWLTMLLSWLCCYHLCMAQTNQPPLKKVEYFFDKDSGAGKQISMFGVPPSPLDTVRTPSPTNLSITIPTTLSVGLHTIHIRANSDSGWSHYSSALFYVRGDLDTLPYITGAEYFMDKDSGTGKVIALTGIGQGATIQQNNFPVNISNLKEGLHTMNLRAYNSNGSYSHYASQLLYVRNDLDTLPYADAVEYFFDNDKGAGKSFALSPITAKDTIRLTNKDVSIDTLSEGLHTMHIRARNAGKQWGHYASQLLYVTKKVNDMPSIVSGEYFLDHDPGVGLGVSFKVDTPGNVITMDTIPGPPPGTPIGNHLLCIRVKDSDGHWGLYQDSIRVDTFTLPITGLTLSAEKKNKTSLLKWYTLTESNSNHFEVEKSLNGIGFSSFGTVKAKGNSNSKSDYNFTDAEPATGLNYYRIKEVDNDGKFAYSRIVKLWFDKDAGTLAIYPNPAANTINIRYASSRENAIINIYDAAGKWVKLYRLPDSNSLSLNISSLASGTYTLHISDGVDVQTGKFVKK